MEAENDAAACLRLIQRTGIRVGSDAETGAKVKAYGASTLRREHVIIDGDTVRLDFIAKKGVRYQHEITDAGLARDLERRLAGTSDRLFQTTDARVRDYLHAIDGGYKVHDLRTWNARDAALSAIEGMPVPQTAAERAKAVRSVGKIVGAHLNDTPKVVLKSYIDPEVFDIWPKFP
jgi:DNA topoisomerase-1